MCLHGELHVVDESGLAQTDGRGEEHPPLDPAERAEAAGVDHRHVLGADARLAAELPAQAARAPGEAVRQVQSIGRV